MVELVKVEKITTNGANPRHIKDGKYKKLKKSLQEFPEMLEKRPIIIDEDLSDDQISFFQERGRNESVHELLWNL